MTKEIQALQIRSRLGEMLDMAKYKKDLFVVKRGQEPMGVYMGFEDYQRLTGLLELLSNALGSKLTKVLDVKSIKEVDSIVVQSRSLIEKVMQNEKFLTNMGLSVKDLLADLSVQRDKYNQEKYGIKINS